jgi:hypothetical protein
MEMLFSPKKYAAETERTVQAIKKDKHGEDGNLRQS